MTAAASCPDVRLLEQLAAGTMPRTEVEVLAQHCARCGRCLEVLRSLQGTKTLVEALARLETLPHRPTGPAVSALIEQLMELPMPLAATHGPEPDLTAGPTPSPDSSPDIASPEWSQHPPEVTEEVYPFLAPARDPGELGRLGPYRILQVLGAGGMGIVFLAEDEQLRRRVALKIMRPALAARPGSRERFLLEARATAAVKDDHIVTIYQVAEDGGVPFIAMELLEGMPLNRWLHAVPMPAVDEVVRLGRQVALGLAAAHERGLIHRDVKPGNIWLERPSGGAASSAPVARVKLLDFGLVRAAADDVRLTHSGAIVGTPAYMAPEQARGEAVDARCDLFSLGCVLYRLCTGRKPFRGDTALALLTALAVDNPRPVRELNPSVPSALSDLVMRLLAKDPAARPPSARAVADELGALERELVEPAPARRGRRRLLTLAGALCVAAALVAGIVIIIRNRHRQEVARITVPEGHSAEVQQAPGEQGGQKEEPSPKPAVPIRSVPLAPLPLEPEPVSATALVRRPLRLRGVRSWDIEFKDGVGSAIKRFAWSPSVQTVAVIDASDRASLLSVDTGQVLAELPGACGPMGWAPDGSHLATAGPGPALLVWDGGGKGRPSLTGHRGPVHALAWAPDGKRLASAAAGDKRVLIWDLVKAEQVGEVGPLPATVESVTWSPDGRLVACNVPEVGWHFWDVAKKKLVNDPKQWQAAALDFAPDSRSALVTPKDRDGYRVRDVTDGRELGRLSRPLRQPGLARTWSPDGGGLAIPGDGCVELWRSSLRRQLFSLPAAHAPARQIAFSSDGKLLMALAGARLYIWEAETRRLRGILLPGAGYHGLTVSPEGYYAGDERVERDMLIRVRENSGRESQLTPAAFEHTHGFKNHADAVHLLRPLEATLPPSEGQPMGPFALVRHPAELLGALSWTVETCSSRYPAGALAYRPNGKLLATGSEDGTIRLWDPADGKLVRMLIGHPVASLAWSPDGQLLAAGGVPGYPTALWEADTGRLLRRLVPGARMCWAPDGATLAIANLQTVYLWDMTTERYRSFGLPQPIASLAWSPDGKTLALGVDRTTVLWDVASNKERKKLEGTGRQVIHGLAWAPKSKWLVTVEYGTLAAVVWDVETGKRLRQLDTEAAFLGPSPVAWSADGKRVILGSNRFTYLFDPENGRRLLTLEEDREVKAVALAADGSQLATASLAGVRLHNGASGERTHTLETARPHEDVHTLGLAPNGGRLVVCPRYSERGDLRILETTTGRPLPAPPEAVGPAEWSPDGKLFVAGSRSRSGSLWDGVTMHPLRGLEGCNRFCPGLPVAWSGDGQRLAVALQPTIWVWSAATGKLLWQDDKQQEIMDVAWSPDGRRLATSRARGQVRLYDASGKLLHELPYALQLAWSPDGKTLAASSAHLQCLLLDPDSGSIRARIPPGCPHWSADGQRVVTCAGDGRTLYVSDGATGKRLLTRPLSWLPGPVHSGEVKHAWSADGGVLALTNGHQVHLFDAGGWPLGVLLPGEPFERLTIRPDGHYRGTARVDREIRMVVLKADGSSETLPPEEFARRYGWHNDPVQVRLTD